MNISRVRQLHERALRVAQAYLGAEAELIEILQGMDETKGFRHYGAKSLFDYATNVLKLSTATTFNLTTVARKSREVPALKEAIRSGTLTLSKARKTVPVLTVANQSKWIGLAQTLTSRELEREVAKARDLKAGRSFDTQEDTRGRGFVTIGESATIRSGSRLDRESGGGSQDTDADMAGASSAAPGGHELRVPVTKELMRKIERVKALLAHEFSKPASLEMALEASIDAFLERKDPLWSAGSKLKAVTGQARPASVAVKAPATVLRSNPTRR